MRAALYIARRYTGNPPQNKAFLDLVQDQITDKLSFAGSVIDPNLENDQLLRDSRNDIQERMTSCGAHVRDPMKIKEAIKKAWQLYKNLQSDMKIPSYRELPDAFKNLDQGLTHALYLEAIAARLRKGRAAVLILSKIQTA